MNPPQPCTTRRLKRIAPLQLGKRKPCLYGAMGLIAVPFFLLISAMTANLPPQQRGIFAILGVGFALAAPFLDGARGWIVATVNQGISRSHG